jgi:hypothetical protein
LVFLASARRVRSAAAPKALAQGAKRRGTTGKAFLVKADLHGKGRDAERGIHS